MERTFETFSQRNPVRPPRGFCAKGILFVFLFFWARPFLYPADPDFTFVIIPDSQKMVQTYPAVWTSLCQWIVDNQSPLNIQAVLSVGDVQDDAIAEQFDTAVAGYNLIATAGVPYVPIMGNHDYDATMPSARSTSMFDLYFGPSYFDGKLWYGGNLDASNANYYVRFTVGARKFLVVALEMYPRPASVTWAYNVIAANSDREVIVLTHGYLSSDGTMLADDSYHGPNDYSLPEEDASGVDMWNNLVRRMAHIRAVICGHVSSGPHTAYRGSLGYFGNLVHQIFNDYQSADNGGDGWIGLLTFHPDLQTADLSYYRTYATSGLGTDPASPTRTLAWPVVGDGSSNSGGSEFGRFVNIFNPHRGQSLSIPLEIAFPTAASLIVYDRYGHLIRVLLNANVSAGTYPGIPWDGRNEDGEIVASGTYVLLFKTGDTLKTAHVVVVK